jgi:SAM-dependent methyltransferase
MFLAPTTERLFREAGVGLGQRVLDVGSGMGDVAMIAARVVGPRGRVVGIDRHPGSVARATKRIAAAGFRNITFIEADANDLTIDGSFDAVVGRSILIHCPDPVATLRSVAEPVISGGIVAFQEVALQVALAVAAPVPLWSRLLSSIDEIFRRSGTNSELGLGLYRTFQEAGLRAPHMHLDMPIGDDAEIVQSEVDLLRTLGSAANEHHVSLANLGDLDTLVERIQAEAAAAHTFIPFVAIVSAWSRKIG